MLTMSILFKSISIGLMGLRPALSKHPVSIRQANILFARAGPVLTGRQPAIFTKSYADLAPQAEIMVKRYDKSYLTGVDVDGMKNMLMELMDNGKLYRDENLSVESLANKMSLTIHYLSELLNNNLNVNFFNFINSYRIQEAKKILREECTRSIMSIAFDVGFNSATSFYRTFKKLTGKTAQEYRNDN